MGDRYIFPVVCPNCGYRDDEAYYAPSSGFDTWSCLSCHRLFDIVIEFKLIQVSEEDVKNESQDI